MTRKAVLAVAAIAGLAAPLVIVSPLSAQSLPAHSWSHGTTLAIGGGAADAQDADTRPTFGAAFGYEINHWVALEGTGTWLVPKHGSQAFAAELTAVTNLTRPHAVVPFVGAGIGLHRATFDTTQQDLPPFYRQRVDNSRANAYPIFMDPTFVFEGGLTIAVGEHLAVRPGLNFKLVTRDGDTYRVTVADVRVVYHFEAYGVGR